MSLVQVRLQRLAQDAADNEARDRRVRERFEFMDTPAIRAFKAANPGYGSHFDPARVPGPWWNGEI